MVTLSHCQLPYTYFYIICFGPRLEHMILVLVLKDVVLVFRFRSCVHHCASVARPSPVGTLPYGVGMLPVRHTASPMQTCSCRNKNQSAINQVQILVFGVQNPQKDTDLYGQLDLKCSGQRDPQTRHSCSPQHQSPVTCELHRPTHIIYSHSLGGSTLKE